jgi:hypothetical protein
MKFLRQGLRAECDSKRAQYREDGDFKSTGDQDANTAQAQWKQKWKQLERRSDLAGVSY